MNSGPTQAVTMVPAAWFLRRSTAEHLEIYDYFCVSHFEPPQSTMTILVPGRLSGFSWYSWKASFLFDAHPIWFSERLLRVVSDTLCAGRRRHPPRVRAHHVRRGVRHHDDDLPRHFRSGDHVPAGMSNWSILFANCPSCAAQTLDGIRRSI